MKKHPEQQDDELYMGNAQISDVHKSPWKTSRLGNTPLMSDGSLFKYKTDLRPWFIKMSEVESAIRTEKSKDKPDISRIHIFEKWLTGED